jgi:hypothetical protein
VCDVGCKLVGFDVPIWWWVCDAGVGKGWDLASGRRRAMMTTLAFDSLRFARRLRDAGVPEPQADAQAELMAEAFGFYAENILTKDHFEAVLDAKLDARFAQQDAKLDQRFADIDRRFTEQDAKFEKRFADIDRRFAEQDAKFDKRFAEQDAKFDKRFAEQDAKFDKRFAEQDAKFLGYFSDQNAKFEGRFGKLEISQRVHTWMLGFLVLTLGVPAGTNVAVECWYFLDEIYRVALIADRAILSTSDATL